MIICERSFLQVISYHIIGDRKIAPRKIAPNKSPLGQQ